MKNIIALLSVSALCVQAQVTNVSVTLSKTLSSDDLNNIITGVNSLHIAPVELTPDQLASAYVTPLNDVYQIRVAVNPSITVTNITSDTGIDYTIRTFVPAPVIPVFTLDQPRMQAIFDVAVGNVGNMSPPITVSNFAFIRLAKDTNDNWTVTSKLK